VTAIAPDGAPKLVESQLREAAISSLERKRKLVQDAFGYVAVNGVLWLIWALADRSTDGFLPWPAWVSLIWGFLLALDAWRAYGPWPRQVITDDDVEQELRRLGR